jgi:hypothetical protein
MRKRQVIALATRHMAKAQFQSGFNSISRQANITRESPLTASEACEVLDKLRGEIDSSISDREVRQEAARAIDYLKGRIRNNASYGITGRGFGQTWDKREFRVGNYTYRVDFELSGEIKN